MLNERSKAGEGQVQVQSAAAHSIVMIGEALSVPE